MTKLVNISDGPRGLHTTEGLVMVDPGGTFDGQLAKGEEANKEWFASPGSKAAREAAAEDEAEASEG